jgi:hypothetical protein
MIRSQGKCDSCERCGCRCTVWRQGSNKETGRRHGPTEMFASELLNVSVMASINVTQVNVRYLEQGRGHVREHQLDFMKLELQHAHTN